MLEVVIISFYLEMCCLNLSYYQRFVFRLIDFCFFLFAVGVEHSSWSGRLISPVEHHIQISS